MLALLLAGCASGGHAVPGAGQQTGPPPGAGPRTAVTQARVSVRVVLPSQTIMAGSSMAGHVLVGNQTGHALHVSGCLSLFQVLLTSRAYRPAAAWALCLQRFTIPAGQTRYPVTVWASYNQCGQGGPRHGIPACLPGGRMPPLPPGTYRARLFQARPLAHVPPAITVRVLPAKRP